MGWLVGWLGSAAEIICCLFVLRGSFACFSFGLFCLMPVLSLCSRLVSVFVFMLVMVVCVQCYTLCFLFAFVYSVFGTISMLDGYAVFEFCSFRCVCFVCVCMLCLLVWLCDMFAFSN